MAVIVHPNRWASSWDAAIIPFLQEQGSVTTMAIAHRFGIDVGDARQRMKVLEAAGKVVSRKVVTHKGSFSGGGVALVWCLPGYEPPKPPRNDNNPDDPSPFAPAAAKHA